MKTKSNGPSRDRSVAERGPPRHLDRAGEAGVLDVLASGLGVAGVELAGDDAPARGEARRHRDRRVAGERADLEHPLRPEREDEHLEQAAFEGADHHPGVGEIARVASAARCRWGGGGVVCASA